MSECLRIREMFPRAAEGDASPEESLLLARHVSGCTSCRIVLARERRLHDVLAELRDPIEVESSFLDRVMAALPSAPRSAKASDTRRRGLKLAGLGGLLAVLGTAAAAWGRGAVAAPDPSWLPVLTPEMPERWGLLFGAAARLASLALAQLRLGPEAALAIPSPAWHHPLAAAVAGGAAVLLAAACAAAWRIPSRLRAASSQPERP